MDKNRLEKVLGMSLSKEHIKYLRTYYLKFYNDPESYTDSGMISLILDDLRDLVTADNGVIVEESEYVPLSGDVDIFGMAPPNEVRHQGKHDFTERNILWLAFEEHESRLDHKIKNISIDWFLNIVRNVFKSKSMVVDENKLSTLRSYWIQAAEGYAKLGLLEDFSAYHDCFDEMFKRFDEGSDKWDLNDGIKWRTIVYEAFIKDVAAQMKYTNKVDWDMDRTLKRVSRITGCSGMEFEEYIGCFESQVKTRQDSVLYCRSIGDKDIKDVFVEDVREIFDETFQRQIEDCLHYDWRMMLKAKEEGNLLTREDIKKKVLTKAAEEIQKERESKPVYKDEVDNGFRSVELLIDKIHYWFTQKAAYMTKKFDRLVRCEDWDIDSAIEYAETRLSNWDLFFEYMIGINLVMREYFMFPSEDTSEVESKINAIKEEAKNYADYLRPTAIERPVYSSGISTLLKMAEG